MDLFVYGTLQSPAMMAAVAGRDGLTGVPAVLHGYAVATLPGDVVPMIMPSPGGRADGVLFTGLDPFQKQRLDLFEGAFGYTLITVTVEAAQGSHVAQMYVPPKTAETGAGPWDLKDWEDNHLAPTLHAIDEVFSHDPMLDQAQLRRMWPMMEKRGWAKHRAAQTAAPATLRYQPKKGDVAFRDFEPPLGGFFRFDQFEVSHKQFDGSHSADMPREVFVGTDAALILPYDPVRDRVLLVEQIRMGVAVRGDPNPWSLEPVAGMVDARETPLEAALREAEEEAALHIRATEHMLSFYPSPGGTTDYFSCFLGLCDLPDTDSYTGGLATENEDLRLHVLGFDDAMALITTGEINIGPLITMLYWLDRERGRLRASA